MRIRTSLILEESLLAKIDELAGEKQRRAGIIESGAAGIYQPPGTRGPQEPGTCFGHEGGWFRKKMNASSARYGDLLIS